ncbi:hypothetical protein ABFX02_03G009200 [Erythranthe guttata]
MVFHQIYQSSKHFLTVFCHSFSPFLLPPPPAPAVTTTKSPPSSSSSSSSSASPLLLPRPSASLNFPTDELASSAEQKYTNHQVMASTSNPVPHTDTGNKPKSQFNSTVCLTDWWLVKTENEFEAKPQLAVAGFTSREKQAMRVFSSASILKRYDIFTIETTDGICVILKGFINRDRTLENGFPSDVFDHFLFGFPPYWKEYVENFMAKESSPNEVSGFNISKVQSPQSRTMEAEQPRVDNLEKDLGSQDKTDVKRQRKNKKKNSSAVSPTKKSDSVISGSTVEKDSYSVGPTVEDLSNLDMPVNCETNKMKSVNINNPAVTDKVVEGSKIRGTGRILSACRFRNKPENENTIANPRKRNKSSSEDIFSHSEGTVSTRSMSNLKMKRKNNQTSVRMSVGEKISNCISSMGPKIVEFADVDCETRDRNIWDFEFSEVHEPTDKIYLSNLDAGSVIDKSEQISRMPSKDKDSRKVKTAGRKKAKHKATGSLSTVASANNQKDSVIPDVNCLSEKTKASATKTRRKLAYETPSKEKTKVPIASPQSYTSVKRSRSGRLLTPTLEFWRNERAIYKDGTMTGIEGMQQP